MLHEIHGHSLFGAHLTPDSVVIDLGAHRGAFSRDMVGAFGCRCYAVEANPAQAQHIPPDPRISVHQVAIAGHSGTLTLHLSNRPEESSLLKSHGDGAITVQALTLPDFLASMHLPRVDLVKFDIEGAEIEAIEACSDAFLQTIPQITVEFHDFLGLTPVATIERLAARLEGLGFDTLKMWRSAWGDTLFVNRARAHVSAAEIQYAKRVTTPARQVRKAVGRLLSA